jgi:chorismate--pyruvate lyase
VPPTRWYPNTTAARLVSAQLVDQASAWLTLPGSLTRALQLRSQHRFHVDVLQEGFARPHLEEARTLGTRPELMAWIREVQLCGDSVPWVTARTVIPLATLTGPDRRLRHLGRHPLGAFLFSNRRWQRGPLRVGITCPDTDGPPAIGRRSCFFNASGQALLVGEYFHEALLVS